MTYDANRHHRRSIRLPDYDYARAGAYFVTVCAEGHTCLFGDIIDGQMRLTRLGENADECWQEMPVHFGGVRLDAFVVMPNHVHGIIMIADAGGATVGATHASPVQQFRRAIPNGPKPRSIGTIIGSYKSAVSKRINDIRATPGVWATHASPLRVWQRNYYEHVIRNQESLNRIRLYIMNNPASWMLDRENPQAECYGQEERIEQS
jgi:REP element-mobilizing transposase RayT